MSEAEATTETNAETTTESAAPSIEERAQRMGWTPKEKFRGDPERWVDATTFVKNGEESLPILRERLRKLETTNADLAKSAAEFKKMSDQNFEKGYAKAKRDLEADIKAKTKAGDADGAVAAANELADLEREKTVREAKGDADPVFDAWAAENSWYTEDKDLAVEAEGVALILRKRGNKKEGPAFLNDVKEELKKRMPEKFGNPRRAAAGAVERTTAGGENNGGGKKGWEHLPADAKDAGTRYIKQGLYKDKAAYAAAYHEQN